MSETALFWMGEMDNGRKKISAAKSVGDKFVVIKEKIINTNNKPLPILLREFQKEIKDLGFNLQIGNDLLNYSGNISGDEYDNYKSGVNIPSEKKRKKSKSSKPNRKPVKCSCKKK
jgi:hypothetical protein